MLRSSGDSTATGGRRASDAHLRGSGGSSAASSDSQAGPLPCPGGAGSGDAGELQPGQRSRRLGEVHGPIALHPWLQAGPHAGHL
ncbi:unnamed protein product, partial [Symbiodinium necroappetens]